MYRFVSMVASTGARPHPRFNPIGGATMSLTSLDKKKIRTYLTEAWKKHLDTSQDPAHGEWWENDPNGHHKGLYGDLTDELSTELVFDVNQRTYSTDDVVGCTATVDNRNGLTPDGSIATLTYAYQDSTQSTHSETNTIEIGVEYDFGVSFEIVEESTKFSFKYTYSWTNSTSETKGTELTYADQVTVKPPAGKIYMAVLVCTVKTMVVPTRALIRVKGTTETWFGKKVEGHYNWSTDAGSAFLWINQFGAAGTASSTFGRSGTTGIITQAGSAMMQKTADFRVQTYDVTDTPALRDGQSVPGVARVMPADGSSPIIGGVLVSPRAR